MIDNIAGINIWTDNFKEMSNFYENILSLKVHSTKDNWISFEYLDFRLNIGTHSMVNKKNNDSHRIMINLLSNNAYAQNDPNILLRIATQADKQILNQFSPQHGVHIRKTIINY